MYSDPLDILDNILVFSMYFGICHQLLTRRYSLWGTILAESILFVVHMFIGNSLPFRSVWRILYWPMLHVTVLCFLYREKWYRILSLVLLLLLGVWLTELIGVITYYSPEMLHGDLKSGSLADRILIRFLMLLSLALVYWVLLLLLKKHIIVLSKQQYLLYIGFPFSVVVFIHFWVVSVLQTPNVNSIYMFFSLSICLISFGLIFVVLFRTTNLNILEIENRRLAHQIELQQKHYEGLSKQYDNVRIMRHDIAKHMNVIKALLYEGKNREAVEYFAEIQELSSGNGYGICEHPIADAFLYSFNESAISAGVRTSFSINLPSEIGIAPSDLICLFGNLLDNALEACADSDEPFIVVRSTVIGDFLLISMDNSISQSAKKETRHIPQLPRGLGTIILQQIASKYSGSFTSSIQKDRFHCEVTLKAGVV